MSQDPPAPRPTLLVVDDEPDVLDSLRHLFHRRYRVLGASNAREALGLLEVETVQVVLTDQRMPGMTGDELLARARAIQPHAVRLLFTGFADVQAVIQAVNQGGIFRYILKPWNIAELESIVAQAAAQSALLADRQRLLDELREANARLLATNRELAEANALKTTFLEVASHELNTPITIIQGYADLFPWLCPEPTEPVAELIEQIGQSARQLGGLVASMLKLMQANEYRRAIRPEPTNLAELLREVASQLHPFTRARDLHVELCLEETLGDFAIDREKIRDVVTNLLSNAIKFTPDGGELWISLHGVDDGRTAEIRVEDRGIGLDERALSHLFEPFFTEIDPGQHSSGAFGFGKRGIGLGLSLVKTFVELHGGTVQAQSRPGEGTRITVRLPRSPCPPGVGVVDSDASSGGSSH